MKISDHITDSQKKSLFLTFFNDYLTIEKFAEHYGLSYDGALDLINEGKELHEAQFIQKGL